MDMRVVTIRFEEMPEMFAVIAEPNLMLDGWNQTHRMTQQLLIFCETEMGVIPTSVQIDVKALWLEVLDGMTIEEQGELLRMLAEPLWHKSKSLSHGKVRSKRR